LGEARLVSAGGKALGAPLVATRVVLRLTSGSSAPVVVDTPRGRFVAKLRGAGHGVVALIAELIVAELAEALDLPVPERVLLTLPGGVPSDDRNDELADLLERSAGLNLGFRLLEGARPPSEEALGALDDELVGRLLFLDGLTMNLDRTDENPNLLLWKGRPWLIDHGSALPFHHDWSSVTEASPREPYDYGRHVFRDRLSVARALDGTLAARLDRQTLAAATARVPDPFLEELDPGSPPPRSRAAYEAFLWKRLKAPRPFL
jgi:hypothetical protein